MSVVVMPSARERFTPHELTAVYEDFTKCGPQYLDAETGLRAAAYRFGERMLIVYQESEKDVVVLIHPSVSWPLLQGHPEAMKIRSRSSLWSDVGFAWCRKARTPV